jgi:hypothetical protein
VPGRVRARMPVQEQDRHPRAAVPDPQGRLSDVDPVELEAVEHVRCHEVIVAGARYAVPGRQRARYRLSLMMRGLRLIAAPSYGC